MKLLNSYLKLKDEKPIHFYSVLLVTLSLIFLVIFITISYVEATATIDGSLYATRNVHNGSAPTIVFTSDLVGYVFYVDSDGTCAYNKTTDGGTTWGGAVTVDSQNDCIRIAVWHDRWTPGDSGDIIHISTIDTGSSDVYYTALDTSTDVLTATVNATGANQNNTFTVNHNLQSITKGTDGDLYMGIQDNDDSYVIKCSSTCDNGANWVEAGVNPFDLANDWLILMPLAGGDVIAVRSDLSANSVQSKVYTDSTDTWDGSWTDIDTSAPADATYDAPFGATLSRLTNDIYLVYAAETDVFGTDDDIRTAVYSGGAWTAKADVLTDDAKGITGAKVALDENTGNIYALYTGQTAPGTLSSANIYYKKSTDGMTSWGTEQGPLNTNDKNFFGARVNIMSNERLYFTVFSAGSDNLLGDTVADLAVSESAYSFLRTFPTRISILVNQKESPQCVSSREITLRLEAQGASQVVISNAKNFIDADWEPFTSPMDKTWMLEPGDGAKTIYILFKSLGGNLSNLQEVTLNLKSSGCLSD